MKRWRCQKPQKVGVGMTMCRQGKLHKDYTSDPIPTSFIHYVVRLLYYHITGNSIVKHMGMGLLV